MRTTCLTILLVFTQQITADEKSPSWDGKETIAEYAKRTKLEPTLTLDLGGNLKWEGVLIPAGLFLMGTPPGETKNEKDAAFEKQHKVMITKPFYMGKYETTQAQYQKIMEANPSATKGDDLPVHNVSWNDAQAFCHKFGAQTKHRALLPTEAQWERACRAGTMTAYCNGDTIADLDKVGWHGGNSERKIQAVGQKLPNAWGVYDMHGNIREFVQDMYGEYPEGDATDPTGPKDGDAKNHVVRGGAFTANAAIAGNCRSASRKPTEVLTMTGFRIAVEVK